MKVSFDITLSRACDVIIAETFAVRRLIASTFGLRQTQDTNRAAPDTKTPLRGFTNMVNHGAIIELRMSVAPRRNPLQV